MGEKTQNLLVASISSQTVQAGQKNGQKSKERYLCIGDAASKYVSEYNPALSSYYGNLIVNIAKKSVLKIHPDIKRQLCKKCRCMLIHNVTARMKIKKKSKSKIIEWTCKACGTKRTFPASKDKDHRLWVERPEAVVEVITED